MIAVMTILMSVAMPVWRREAQREKEEELVFRGLQYVRAIRLYQAKNQSFPPSVDTLVQGKYLRRKYKDPITNDDFVTLSAAGGAAGQIGAFGQNTQPGQNAQSPQPGQRGQAPQPMQPQPSQGPQPSNPFGSAGGQVMGGIIGVASKSKQESVRIYQGRTHYNEWQFVFVNVNPGGPGGIGGRGVPGGPGGQETPGGPGGRGRGGRGRGGQVPSGVPGGRGPGSGPTVRPPGGPGNF
jgi:type II secretory pathway pseudopilin PulG